MEFISSSTVGKIIVSRTIMEFDGKTLLSFTFCDKKPAKFSRQQRNGGKTAKVSQNTKNQPASPTVKRKSPSRRKRDRERFRVFLAKKKQAKQEARKVQDANPPVQCTPPSEVLDTVPEPPTVNLSPQPPSQEARAPVEDSPESSTEPLTTQKPAGAYCLCDVCNRFNTKGSDTDPITEQHTACNKCGKPATFMEPLKPCSRCIICAYCSKDCQTADWSNHKQHCKKETGDQAKELRAKWYEAREVWLDHIFEPLIPSST